MDLSIGSAYCQECAGSSVWTCCAHGIASQRKKSVTRIERSINIDAPPSVVFDRLTDWANLQGWSTITEEHNGSDRCSGRGEEFTQKVRVAGLPLHTHWRVSAYDPPRQIAYEVTARAGGHMTMAQSIRPTDGGSTVEFHIDYHLPGGLLGGVVDLLLARRRSEGEAERSLGNLKQLLEGSRLKRRSPPLKEAGRSRRANGIDPRR
jgi:uncharacterized protein YndB with AHSA1/START domain